MTCAPCETLRQQRCPEHGVPEVRCTCPPSWWTREHWAECPANPRHRLLADVRTLLREELRAVGLVPRDAVREVFPPREPE